MRTDRGIVAADLPDVAARYRKLADDFRVRAAKRSPDTHDTDIDRLTKDKLKALGYGEWRRIGDSSG